MRLKERLSTLARQVRDLADADFLICLVLLAAAWGSFRVFHGEAGAALAGAFMGAFAVLVGNWINRRNELRRRKEQRAEQIAKAKTLVTAELVNVATGMIGAEDTLSGFVRSFLAGAVTHERYDLAYLSPRLMPRTAALSSDLLISIHAP